MLTRYPLHSPWRSVLAVAWTLLVCLLLLQPGRDPLVGPAAAGDHSPPVVLLLNLGHFLCFAVMTWLWWRALAQIRSTSVRCWCRTRPRRAGLLALASLLQLSMRYWLLALPPALLLCVGGLIALNLGLLTELAQTFVPDRGLSALDLALNAGGALLVAFWLRRRAT